MSFGKAVPGSLGRAEQEHGGFLPSAALLLLLLWEGKALALALLGPEGRTLHNRGIGKA